MSYTGIIKTLAISLVLTFAQLGSPILQASMSERATGKLKVAILDTIDRIVPNISVTIDGNNTRRTFVSGDQEYYEFDLPAGTYAVTTNKGNRYYHPFRRSAFFLKAGATTLINVLPIMRVIAIGTGVGEESSFVNLASEPKFDALKVPTSVGPEIELTIQYDRRLERGKVIAYEDGVRPFSGVATFDVLTIISDAITVDKETLRIEAAGNVIIEDGPRRTHAKQKIIEFKDGKPVIGN